MQWRALVLGWALLFVGAGVALGFAPPDIQRFEASASCAGCDLSTLTLKGGLREGLDLSGARLWRAHLEEVQWPGVNLRGADLEESFCNDSSFIKGNFRAARLYRAYFKRTDLVDADMAWVQAEKLWADGARLVGADLTEALLYKASFNGADLREANLKGALLVDSDLRGADLRGADLRGAMLVGAQLDGAQLEGAQLDGASWINGYICASGSLGRCIQDRIELPPDRLKEKAHP